jgi:hypothetical protein
MPGEAKIDTHCDCQFSSRGTASPRRCAGVLKTRLDCDRLALTFAIKCLGRGCRRNLRRSAVQKEQDGRLVVVITRRVSLDRLYGGEALCDARGGVRVERNEKSCFSPATAGRFFPSS